MIRTWLERVSPAFWRTLIVASVLILFVVATNNAAYNVTTPGSAPHHSMARKALAVGAFALLGFLLERARVARLADWPLAMIVALFSFGIEIGQIVLDHSRETLLQHGFDVFSGLAGGLLGVSLSRALRPGGMPTIVGVVRTLATIALLLAGYELSYGRYRGFIRAHFG